MDLTDNPAVATFLIYPTEIKKLCSLKKLYKNIDSSFFTISKTGNDPNVFSGWINKLW